MAAVRTHQAIRRPAESAGHAEVGIPTTQPILGVADEDSPDYRADRAYLALSPHRITLDQWKASGSTRKPDPAIYQGNRVKKSVTRD
jgi:hypothetical protein